MSTTVTEIPLDAAGASKPDQAVGRSAVRRFHVLFSTALEGNAVLARIALGVPRIGSPHPNDLYMWVSNIEVRPVGDSRILYEAECQYTSARGGDANNSNPLSQPPVINWDWEISTEPIDQDEDGVAIVNVNGEPYDPPLTADVADARLIIERNYASFDPFVLQTYKYVVNSDSFLGFPAGCALLKPIRARSQSEGQFVYWVITAEITFRVDRGGQYDRSWHQRILQRGFKVRPGAGLPAVWYTDSDGQRTPTPVLLKADGTLAANVAQAAWLYHKMYRSMPFAVLNLL